MNREECNTPKTWPCPVCGVPLTVGETCECGTRIEQVVLTELPAYFHKFDWKTYLLELLEVSPEGAGMENQSAVFLVVPPVEKKNKDAKINVLVPPNTGVNIIDWAIFNLIEEYKYRKDCSIVEELKEKYENKIRKWKNTQIRITANQRHYIHEAATAWDIDIRKLTSLFLAYILDEKSHR